MVYDNSPLTIEERDKRDASAVDVSIRLWIQQHTADEVELAADLTRRKLFEIANRVMFETGFRCRIMASRHCMTDARANL